MATKPRQVIDSVVGSVCGHGVEQLVRLTAGGMNETYRVELAGAGSVVVRIARQPVPWFIDEAHRRSGCYVLRYFDSPKASRRSQRRTLRTS